MEYELTNKEGTSVVLTIEQLRIELEGISVSDWGRINDMDIGYAMRVKSYVIERIS